MNTQVTFTGSAKDIAGLLALVVGKGETLAIASTPSELPKRGRGRPSKEAIAAREAAEEHEEEELEEETDEDETGGDEDTEEEDSDEDDEVEDDDEEEPAPVKKAAKPSGPTDRDVIKALQLYAKKHSREKAQKVLAKYKVKKVIDLPASKYAEVLKLLKVKG